MYVQADGLVVSRRTLISMMLSDWKWEVSSLVEPSHRVCERDEVEMFGTSTPQGQAALVLSVGYMGYSGCCSCHRIFSGLRVLVADVLPLTRL